jgi:hypothetical protein
MNPAPPVTNESTLYSWNRQKMISPNKINALPVLLTVDRSRYPVPLTAQRKLAPQIGQFPVASVSSRWTWWSACLA